MKPEVHSKRSISPGRVAVTEASFVTMAARVGDREVSVGQEGELLARGPQVFQG